MNDLALASRQVPWPLPKSDYIFRLHHQSLVNLDQRNMQLSPILLGVRASLLPHSMTAASGGCIYSSEPLTQQHLPLPWRDQSHKSSRMTISAPVIYHSSATITTNDRPYYGNLQHRWAPSPSALRRHQHHPAWFSSMESYGSLDPNALHRANSFILTSAKDWLTWAGLIWSILPRAQLLDHLFDVSIHRKFFQPVYTVLQDCDSISGM